MAINDDTLEVLEDILSHTERHENITVTLDAATRTVTIVFADLDEGGFEKLQAAAEASDEVSDEEEEDGEAGVVSIEPTLKACAACGLSFVSTGSGWSGMGDLCCCREGAKADRGAELRYKSLTGECYQTGCAARAHGDGWCDEHSEQYKRYGTHHPVGMTGPSGPGP